jgi:ureidoacrylate peracid hydrolase
MSDMALVFVDIQRDFWEPFKELPEYAPFPDNVKRLREYAKENGVPVIHIHSLFSKNRRDWMLFYRPEGRGTIPCITGTDGAGFADFAEPSDGEKVITKQVFDSFNGTELHEYLSELGVKTVLISGIETSVCVLFTATSAYLNRVLPVVVYDACADSPERHSRTLEMYGDLCFKTLSTDQVIGESGELMQLIETFSVK